MGTWRGDGMSETTVVCEGTCTLVVQLDAAYAIQQIQQAFPEWEQLQPVFWGCVTLLVIGFLIRMGRKALD